MCNTGLVLCAEVWEAEVENKCQKCQASEVIFQTLKSPWKHATQEKLHIYVAHLWQGSLLYLTCDNEKEIHTVHLQAHTFAYICVHRYVCTYRNTHSKLTLTHIKLTRSLSHIHTHTTNIHISHTCTVTPHLASPSSSSTPSKKASTASQCMLLAVPAQHNSIPQQKRIIPTYLTIKQGLQINH